jgi:DNA helicase II / ATP-dependent DNA helicase PcrA
MGNMDHIIENLKQELTVKGIKLNEQQLAAAMHKDGPHLIISCPGSGKTTTLVIKLYILIKYYKVNPLSILTMTFSRVSARDMENRFYKLFPDMPKKTVRFSTLHSFAYSVIKNYERIKDIKYNLIENNDSDEDAETDSTTYTVNTNVNLTPNANIRKIPLLKKIYNKITQEYINDEQLDTLLSNVSFVSNKMIPVSDFDKYKFETKNFKEVYCAYKDFKQDNRLIDFDDMLTLAYSILQGVPKILEQYRSRYRYVCLDEGQDTSVIQFCIVKLLASPSNNLCVIGDDDQTLYSWRGAEPKELLDFKRNYPKSTIYYMETNYRSSQNIVEAADKFIKDNKSRYNKNMKASREKGEAISFHTAIDEIDYAKQIINIIKKRECGHELKEYAVLFRNNNSAVVLADQFRKNGIPYFLKDTKLYLFSHWVTTDIISFLKLSLDDTDIDAFEKVYFKMDLYLSKSVFEYVKRGNSRNSIFQRLLECNALSDSQKEKVQRYEKRMQLMHKLVPDMAIDHIVSTLQYDKYLAKNADSENNNIDSLYSIINSLKAIAADCNSIYIFFDRLDELERDIKAASRKYGLDAVNFSTLHSSKGCEYKTVFMSANQNELPSSASLNADWETGQALLEEERRVFYVGITRAKTKLHLYTLLKRNGKAAKPSQFYDALFRIAGAGDKKGIAKAGAEAYSVDTVKSNSRSGENSKYKVDSIINHKMYGHGYIAEIRTDKLAETCIVKFGKVGVKHLDVRFCLEKGIVTILE